MTDVTTLEYIKNLARKIELLEVREHSHSFINLGTPTELTIAGGIITRTGSYHLVDTEGDAAADDLDTILGGVEGDLLFLMPANVARVVTVKDGTGNILMPADMVLDQLCDIEVLIYRNGSWCEITASSNA